MSAKSEGSATTPTTGEPATNDADAARVERTQRQMGRRTFLAATAGTAAAVVATGGVAAQEGSVNFGTDVVQDPRVEKAVTIAEHTADMSSALEYINDSGEEVSLADHGAAVAPRSESDEPHNPVTLRADKFATAEYSDFPRGETYEDSDGDEQDLSALDAQHWSESGLTVETVSGANDQDVVQISGSSGSATFSDVEITSGTERKYLQLVASVNDLPSGATVTVSVVDSADNTIDAVIDPSADSTATGTIATETGAGQVYQEQLGEFSTSLEDIVELEVSISGDTADVTLAGLNVERESRWGFGSREYLNDDDELETETVREPTGEFSITELSSLPSVFDEATLVDVGVDAEFMASELSSSDRRSRWGDASAYDYPNRLETLVGFELPTAYDLSYGDGKAVDEVLFPESRYVEVGFSREDELPSWSDVDDESVSWTDRTSEYESSAIGDDVELTPSVSTGEMLVVYADTLLNDENRSAATSPVGGGGGPIGSSGGFLGSPMSIIMTVLATVAGYVGYVRGLIPGMGN